VEQGEKPVSRVAVVVVTVWPLCDVLALFMLPTFLRSLLAILSFRECYFSDSR
jgi:hypothetical protein